LWRHRFKFTSQKKRVTLLNEQHRGKTNKQNKANNEKKKTQTNNKQNQTEPTKKTLFWRLT